MSFRIPDTKNTKVVSSSSDLPYDSVNSEYVLRDNTTYRADGFSFLSKSIRLGNITPIIAGHAAQDGFIYDGGGDMIVGNNKGVYLRNCYIHAPGGTIFNVAGDIDTEVLIQFCAFTDKAGIANIASLGSFDGFRVPSFKVCNFENFNEGIRFTGDSSIPVKVLIDGSPFREIDQSGVTIITFGGSIGAGIVDARGNYFKSLQPNTEVVRVESGATPTEIFNYTQNTHDESVVKSNILTGEAGVGVVGYNVSNSSPLRDSAVIGEVSLDNSTETTISSQDSWTQVAGNVTLGNESERISLTGSNGQVQYDGRRTSNVQIVVGASILGGNGTEYAIAIAKNGTVEPTSRFDFVGGGTQSPQSAQTSAIEDLEPGDTLSLYVRNNDGTGNITFRNYNFSFKS